jgi:hypothetical protein
MEPLEAKSASKLHNTPTRTHCLYQRLAIVIQIEECVPTRSRFQHAVDCKSCSDDCHRLIYNRRLAIDMAQNRFLVYF